MTLSRATAGILGRPPLRSILIGSRSALFVSGGAALTVDAVGETASNATNANRLIKRDGSMMDGQLIIGSINGEGQQGADGHLC